MSHTELYLMPNKISTLTHPGWIPAEASIPFSRNAFRRPYIKKGERINDINNCSHLSCGKT